MLRFYEFFFHKLHDINEIAVKLCAELNDFVIGLSIFCKRNLSRIFGKISEKDIDECSKCLPMNLSIF